MKNLIIGTIQKDFYVWVDPNNFLTQHQVGILGLFTSVPKNARLDNLMFVPNPGFKGFLSPFQNNLLSKYTAEYNLEMGRRTYFPDYPSRLEVIFLLENEEDAHHYKERHHIHVGDRILKKVRTTGDYCYSLHASSWVDFCRIGHSTDPTTIDFVSKAYWNGQHVNQHTLQSMGKTWTQDPITEVLYLGRVDFYDKNLCP